MECTQDLHHQQQLEQQQQEEEKVTYQDLNNIAYRCLGVAQSIRDLREVGNSNVLLLSEKRLIELANEFDVLHKRYWGQK